MTYDIYFPEEDSHLLAEAVEQFAFGSVLDIGTGSGVQAITAAKKKDVRCVLAVDINPDAVKYVKDETKRIMANASHLQNPALHPHLPPGAMGKTSSRSRKIETNYLKKISVKRSDLFSAVPKSAKFDTIIFNPPYLPYDRHETGGIATANSGGKHGYELLVRFLNEANSHLAGNGRILIVFSTLTKQMKIDEAIKKNMLVSMKISEKSFFMEKLLVYMIEKSSALKRLEKKKVTDIKFFSEGKRGNIFIGRYKAKQAVIKTKKTASFAESMVDKEALWLRTVNSKFKGKKIAPKFYFADNEICVMEYIDGIPIVEFLESCSKAQAKQVITKMMRKLYLLDQEGLNKEEMHHPVKHIIVRKEKQGRSVYEPYLIDFERMHYVRAGNTKNINQFMIFLSGRDVSSTLNKKGFLIDRNEFIGIAKKYHKGDMSISELMKHSF